MAGNNGPWEAVSVSLHSAECEVTPEAVQHNRGPRLNPYTPQQKLRHGELREQEDPQREGQNIKTFFSLSLFLFLSLSFLFSFFLFSFWLGN